MQDAQDIFMPIPYWWRGRQRRWWFGTWQQSSSALAGTWKSVLPGGANTFCIFTSGCFNSLTLLWKLNCCFISKLFSVSHRSHLHGSILESDSDSFKPHCSHWTTQVMETSQEMRKHTERKYTKKQAVNKKERWNAPKKPANMKWKIT